MRHQSPLNYITRIRHYYQALGYGAPYVWAHFDDVPFSPLGKPLAETTVGIVTTAAPYQPERGDQGPGAAYNGLAKFYSVYTLPISPEPKVCISHVGYDRVHTSASDQGTYFPLKALQQLQSDGEIRALAPRFYGLPSNRSQRTTIDVDCARLVSFCIEDNLDAVVLVPNCPVCHQSVSLAARALEAAGISTVIMGCAKDIVEHVGVPRLLFNNFPLGNSAGLPGNFPAQIDIASQALTLLETAIAPRTTEQSPFIWNGAEDWQRNYSNADLLSDEEIARRRKEFDKGKSDAKRVKDGLHRD